MRMLRSLKMVCARRMWAGLVQTGVMPLHIPVQLILGQPKILLLRLRLLLLLLLLCEHWMLACRDGPLMIRHQLIQCSLQRVCVVVTERHALITRCRAAMI